MRLQVAALIVAATAAVSAEAKRSDFFALDVRPAASHNAVVCGRSVTAARIRAGTTVRALVSLRAGHTSSRRTPFVIAVRRCVSGGLRTTERRRLDVRARRRSASTRIRLPQPGAYRIEALLNGDRPPLPSAIQYVLVTRSASPPPQILSAVYGLFRLAGAQTSYSALRVRTRDPDGQVVGLSWHQVSPADSPQGGGTADGACGLATKRNGAVGTWYLPMTLAPGAYQFEFELTSSPCAATGGLQAARQTIRLQAPGQASSGRTSDASAST
jgi:hypothetical protein